MKNLTLIALMTFYVTLSCAQDDGHYFVGAGLMTSHVQGSGLNIDKEAGFYLQVGITERTSSHFGQVMSLGFQNQVNNFREGLKAKIQNVTFNYSYHYYPFREGLHILAGFQGGYLTSFKVDGENQRHLPFISIAPMAGVGYSFEKFEASVRAARYMGGKPIFQSSFQFGMHYNL